MIDRTNEYYERLHTYTPKKKTTIKDSIYKIFLTFIGALIILFFIYFGCLGMSEILSILGI